MCGYRGGSVCGGIRRLAAIQKQIENWANSEATIITNYSPKFRPLFSILKFSTSTLILYHSHNISTFLCYVKKMPQKETSLDQMN